MCMTHTVRLFYSHCRIATSEFPVTLADAISRSAILAAADNSVLYRRDRSTMVLSGYTPSTTSGRRGILWARLTLLPRSGSGNPALTPAGIADIESLLAPPNHQELSGQHWKSSGRLGIDERMPRSL
ncbi:hypothetical protein BaRGS_00020093 [Batillaria attramentaria]|uniref:Uncharacterized protein n=1 Tax=Batillaria attramentaria TaxID=370345 RepID=A0ABD0KN10_9CAEN